MTEPDETGAAPQDAQLSLSTRAARNLATTTKSAPQMSGISARWLLRALPWVEATGGTYRVNRRLTYQVGDGRVTFSNVGAAINVIPQELRELPMLRDFDNDEVLAAMAARFVQQEYAAGELIVEAGSPADEIVLIAHGKVNKLAAGKYGDDALVGMLGDGDHFSYQALLETDDYWTFSAKAMTACTVLKLKQDAFEALVAQSEALNAHLEAFKLRQEKPQDRHAQAEIALAAGHEGEPPLPGTFVDYETSPREYELSVAQTVLRIHTRVADLYNQPMNQTEQQLRLTVEALRELQEDQLVNNRDFGLLHNCDLKQRIRTHSGPPTPDDFDELISRRRGSRYLLAHPRTIAAFSKQCNAAGIYPPSTTVDDSVVQSWRGVPLLPCTKIPISDELTSSVIVMRTGEDNQGVIGLRQTGLPDEVEPGLSVRFTGINEKAVISYLVSTYYSAAVLVPDALGVLEDCQVGQ